MSPRPTAYAQADAPVRAAVAAIQSGALMWLPSLRSAGNTRLPAIRAGATQSAHRGGGPGRRVLGPLARPILRLAGDPLGEQPRLLARGSAAAPLAAGKWVAC